MALSSATDLVDAVQNERNAIIFHKVHTSAFRAAVENDTSASPGVHANGASAVGTSAEGRSAQSPRDTTDHLPPSSGSNGFEFNTTKEPGVSNFGDSAPDDPVFAASYLEDADYLLTVTEYVSDRFMADVKLFTDKSLREFQILDANYPGWPRYETGNRFRHIRSLVENDSTSVEFVWHIYSNQTNSLRHCPILKGSHASSSDSGYSLLLAFLRTALWYLQDKAALSLMTFASNSSQYTDLLKATVAQLHLSLSVFFAPAGPDISCTLHDVNLDSINPRGFKMPTNEKELLASFLSDITLALEMQACELHLRTRIRTDSENTIQALQLKITLEIMMAILALLVLPTILHSFTKVSEWITIYVSQLEERNKTLAEKTAELDLEKSLTEKLLYEVGTSFQCESISFTLCLLMEVALTREVDPWKTQRGIPPRREQSPRVLFLRNTHTPSFVSLGFHLCHNLHDVFFFTKSHKTTTYTNLSLS